VRYLSAVVTKCVLIFEPTRVSTAAFKVRGYVAKITDAGQTKTTTTSMVDGATLRARPPKTKRLAVTIQQTTTRELRSAKSTATAPTDAKAK
jgi:hypothetical protein